MPLTKNTVPHHVELLLESFFDSIMDSESGIAYIQCSKGRARYLDNWASFIKASSALASVEYLKPDDPNYALGSYWFIQTYAAEDGLYGRIVEKPKMSHDMMLISAAFGGKAYSIECEDNKAAKKLITRLNSRKRRLVVKNSSSKLDALYFTIDLKYPNVVRISATTLDDTVQKVPQEKLDRVKAEMSRAGWGKGTGKKDAPDT